MGTLEILNVAGGDVKITYTKDDAAEAIRAKRIIKDMLKRGYALLVEVDGKFQRIKKFDEAHSEYVIADYNPEGEDDEDEIDVPVKRRTKEKRLSMSSTRATAVGRTAGG